MPQRPSLRPRRSPLTIALAAGAVACFSVALGLWATSLQRQQAMASLSPIPRSAPATPLTDAPAADAPAGTEGAADAWQEAEGAYPGLVAWIEVEGTGISTPVMQATEDDPEWFLDHDALGNESPGGLPFLDSRSSATGAVRTLYAHNLGWGSSEGFGSLADAWQPETFASVGTLSYALPTTPAREATDGELTGEVAAADSASEAVVTEPSPAQGVLTQQLRPLCALKVEPDDPDALCFSRDGAEIRAWLERCLQRATATAPEAQDALAAASAAQSAVALVTCSGDGYPSHSRTVVLFVP